MASDAAADDGGVDGGLDAGPPTECESGLDGVVFTPPIWRAEVRIESPDVNDAVGLAFDDEGDLFVSNSNGWIVSPGPAGNVVRVDGTTGEVEVFATSSLFHGPSHLAHAPTGSDFAPGLYVGVEDDPYPHGIVHVSPDREVSDFLQAGSELGVLRFAPGGAFGTDLYETSYEANGAFPPTDLTLFRVDADGIRTRVALVVDGEPLLGAWSFSFAADGDEAVVGTLETSNTPGSRTGLWRVDGATLEATLLVDDLAARYLQHAPPVGSFAGPYVYATVGSNDATANDALQRIDDRGAVTELATGLTTPDAIAFDGEGMMWLTEPGLDRVLRVTPCDATD